MDCGIWKRPRICYAKCNIIASGGVSSIKDIEDCLELNLYGCICGKALYTGALNLEEAVRKAGVQTC